MIMAAIPKEVLKKSWQFLYDLLEVVEKKFSETDKNSVLSLGMKLLSIGVKYQHQVSEYDIQNYRQEIKSKKLAYNKGELPDNSPNNKSIRKEKGQG